MCPILRFKNEATYDSGLPDIHFHKDGTVDKLDVNVTIVVQDINNIDEVEMKYTVAFLFEARWFDSRLTWLDLNNNSYLNRPSFNQKRQLWIPKIVFSNSVGRRQIVMDGKAKILIEMMNNSDYVMSDQFSLDESASFKGESNPIVYSRELNVDFECTLDLTFFPFDTQVCHMELKAGNKVRNFIQLVPSHLSFTGSRMLSTFYVENLEKEIDLSNENDIDIRITFSLRRRLTQYIIGIFLPSLCILIIDQVRFLCVVYDNYRFLF